MKMAYRKIIIGALVFSMTLGSAGMQSAFAGNAPGSSGSDYQARLRQLIESGDVRYDEIARNGVVVDIVNNPEEYDAGGLLIGTLIVLTVVGLVDTAIMVFDTYWVSKETSPVAEKVEHGVYISVEVIVGAVATGSSITVPIPMVGQTVEFTKEWVLAAHEHLKDDPVAVGLTVAIPVASPIWLFSFFDAAKVMIEKRVHSYSNVASYLGPYFAGTGKVDMAGNYVFLTPHDEMYYGTMDYSRLDLDVVSKGLIKDMELSLALDEWGNVVVLNTEMVKGGSLVAAYDLDHWEAKGALAGLSSFGPIQAPNSDAGSHFGLIHTGLGDASAEGHLDQTFISPRTSAATFAVRYNFVTTEFPEWLASVYNDSFFIELVHVQTGATKVLAKFEGSLNQIFSENDINSWKHVQFSGGLPFQILDMADTGAGQTGWITTSKGNLNLSQGSLYKVQIRVNDVTDEIWDSALLIDKVSLR